MCVCGAGAAGGLNWGLHLFFPLIFKGLSWSNLQWECFPHLSTYLLCGYVEIAKILKLNRNYPNIFLRGSSNAGCWGPFWDYWDWGSESEIISLEQERKQRVTDPLWLCVQTKPGAHLSAQFCSAGGADVGLGHTAPNPAPRCSLTYQRTNLGKPLILLCNILPTQRLQLFLLSKYTE